MPIVAILLGILALAPADFDEAVAPILARRCLDCHSGAEPKGGLDLSRRAGALKGGKEGAAVVPGDLDASLLWEHVDDGSMPPKTPLPAAEKATLRAWIAAGANWGTDPIDPYRVSTERRAGRDWWSLRPVVRPSAPGPGHPIDAFIRQGLTKAGLAPSPPAGRRALVRRLTFDLTGLPPTPEEVEAFVGDARPDAYEWLVDRLLASPDYGVRWARPWLDLARFGESNGFEHDEFRPHAWRYRDWVVDALNRDLPYDEFARLQLAGDLLRPDDPGAIEATGFLVAGAYDNVGQTQQSQAMRKVVREDELEDVVGTVAQAFLGLTVHCARCHDHKFDPIRQADYYRFASSLAGVRQGTRDLSGLDPASNRARAKVVRAVAIGAALAPDPRVESAGVLADLASARATLAARARKAHAVVPRPPGAVHLLTRGNTAQPAEVVSPGGIGAVVGPPADFGVAPDAPDAPRRSQLARWISDGRNPLFARVAVNRAWQGHFGAGLVETPSDFGFNGGQPSHPELLDWLASEFVARGLSLKALHRLVVTSETYKQSSRPDPAAIRVDAANRRLWRKSPTRLEAEMVRDAMLAASGELDPSRGGPGFREFVIAPVKGATTISYTPVDVAAPGLSRRTLYRTWARGGRSGFLDAFDCPDPSTTAPRRASTTTPQQALALLNNGLTLHLAGRLADRLRREAGDDPARQVDLAYRLALGRAPDGDERAAARRVVEQYGGATLARALFNCNEFIYVE